MPDSSPLRVQATLENLNALRDFVEARSRALGLDPESVYGIVLSVDEAATNIVVHGYRGRDGTIEASVERDAGMLVIRLRDDAPPFDPSRVPAPDLKRSIEKRQPGGLGIFFMRHYTDEIAHRARPEGGNELILKKRISGGEK